MATKETNVGQKKDSCKIIPLQHVVAAQLKPDELGAKQVRLRTTQAGFQYTVCLAALSGHVHLRLREWS